MNSVIGFIGKYITMDRRRNPLPYIITSNIFYKIYYICPFPRIYT